MEGWPTSNSMLPGPGSHLGYVRWVRLRPPCYLHPAVGQSYVCPFVFPFSLVRSPYKPDRHRSTRHALIGPAGEIIWTRVPNLPSLQVSTIFSLIDCVFMRALFGYSYEAIQVLLKQLTQLFFHCRDFDVIFC
jgi:hypothetical protein